MSRLTCSKGILAVRLFGTEPPARKQANRLLAQIEKFAPSRESILHTKSREEVAADARVFVVKKLRVDLKFLLPSKLTDLELVQKLTDCWIRAAHTAITSGSGHDVAEFKNRAAYVAAFLTAYVEGQVCDTWVFSEFRKYHSPNTEVTVAAVLREHANILPQIVRELDTKPTGWTDVVSQLSARDTVSLWRQLLGESATEIASEALTLWNLAIRLGTQLGLSPNDPPQTPPHSFQQWCAQGVSWGDKTELATQVLAAIELAFSPTPNATTTLPDSWDWLDRKQLSQALARWLRKPASKRPPTPTDSRVANTPSSESTRSFTPRQRQLPSRFGRRSESSKLAFLPSRQRGRISDPTMGGTGSKIASLGLGRLGRHDDSAVCSCANPSQQFESAISARSASVSRPGSRKPNPTSPTFGRTNKGQCSNPPRPSCLQQHSSEI